MENHETNNNTHDVVNSTTSEAVIVDNNIINDEDIPKENIVNPMRENDLGDKTIRAVENFMNTEDHSEEFNKEDVKNYKTFAILCYVPLVVFYFIVIGRYKDNKYIHFHANQGLTITILWALSTMVSKVLTIVFSTNETFLVNSTPTWVSFVSFTLYCICFLSSLLAIVNTVNGVSKELPFLGQFKFLK